MSKFSVPRHLAQVDRETGEIIEGVFAIMPVRRKNGFSEGWFAMSNVALAQVLTLTTSRELQLRDLEVLFAMLEVLELENFIRVSQKHLGDRLNMLRPNVSRSIRTLIRHGIILEGPKIGTASTYRLNPRFGWKGSAKQHHEALREQMRAPRLAPVIKLPVVQEPERDPLTVDMFRGKADAEEPRAGA